ncbi:MAG: CcoQ/FixQ family Cbb3-type cytochrome c oxidase assembly chaperone [Chitinophagaceae bacterium]|nr:CcoQ/FixQ family Cbb3-type cytochrome c oxidase assembly chaperone [Chitinophagaceae bacterium]
MKFIHYLEKVSGVDIMGLTSLMVFFLFFTAVAVWLFRSRKEDFADISRIPLDN